MTTDYATELESVNDAISAVLTGGQDVWYQGRRVTNADLKSLREHRNDLLKKIDRAERGGIKMQRGVPL